VKKDIKEIMKLFTDGLITSGELTKGINKLKSKTEEYNKLLIELSKEANDIDVINNNIFKKEVESFIGNILEVLKTEKVDKKLKVKELILNLDLQKRNLYIKDMSSRTNLMG
jgi:hypothetical protein